MAPRWCWHLAVVYVHIRQKIDIYTACATLQGGGWREVIEQRKAVGWVYVGQITHMEPKFFFEVEAYSAM